MNRPIVSVSTLQELSLHEDTMGGYQLIHDPATEKKREKCSAKAGSVNSCCHLNTSSMICQQQRSEG